MPVVMWMACPQVGGNIEPPPEVTVLVAVLRVNLEVKEAECVLKMCLFRGRGGGVNYLAFLQV